MAEGASASPGGGSSVGVRGSGAWGDVVGGGWELLCWQGWVSSPLWGLRGTLSLKLKRGEVSAVVGEDGPALDTVLEGPLLSAETQSRVLYCVSTLSSATPRLQECFDKH